MSGFRESEVGRGGVLKVGSEDRSLKISALFLLASLFMGTFLKALEKRELFSSSSSLEFVVTSLPFSSRVVYALCSVVE